MSKLSMAQRRSLPASAFVFPERAPGPDSYPIPDRGHAIIALGDSAGTKDAAAVRRAVCAKFGIGCGGKRPDAEDRKDGGRDEATEANP